MTNYMPDFSKQDYVLIIEALEKRQHCFIAGDKMYNEYASLSQEMRRRMQNARSLEGMMKVGLIGLGRMGEGMSRRMMKKGIEVWGYRRNYEKKLKQRMKQVMSVELPLLWKRPCSSST